ANGTNTATSTSHGVVGGAIAVSKSDPIAEITSDTATDAIIGANSQISTAAAVVTVSAISASGATALATDAGGGVVSAQIVGPVATNNAHTSARLLGNVGGTTSGIGADGQAGTLGTPGAASISVTSAASDLTVSKVESNGGGLVHVGDS